MDDVWPRRPLDPEEYLRLIRSSCFVCDVVARTATYEHHVVYEDELSIAFLARFPWVIGHTLVAPKRHREQVTGDFTPNAYLGLQAVVHQLGEAVRSVVFTERLYVLSLGSRQGNKHVHWHLVPLPAGVPFEEQQAELMRADRGVLQIPEDEQRALAAAIRATLNGA